MKKLYALFLASMMTAGANAQYCTPTCTNPTGSCTYGPVTLFVVNGASSTLIDSLGCTGSGYEDYTSMSSMTCNLAAGGTYTASFTCPYVNPKNCQVWIDYDNDNTFASSESIGGANSWGYSTSITFTVPSGASAGTHRLRFTNEYGGTVRYPSIDPCMGSRYMFGDARDYNITVTSGSSACSGTPSGGTSSAATSGSCGMYSVVLTDAGATSGSGITYQWQESTDGGSTWTNITGGTATTCAIAEPTVTTLYRCVVTCSSSSASANSTTSTITMNRVSGHISYSSASPDTTVLKVWLIDYNASAGTLTAVDSTTTCLDSLTPYFEFNGVSAATYFVKAKSLDYTSSPLGGSGYVPTYGASSPHWSGATTITHAAGTSNTQNITMAYGTVTAGPGFIGGFISSGAGKGTASDVPAVDMLVFLKNASTGVITQVYTDVAGNYLFNGIAYGTYLIYPEVMAYTTTPSAIITLSASHPNQSSVNFKQYTTSKTIKPIGVNVKAVAATPFSVSPNPSQGNLNIFWGEQPQGRVEIVMSDVMGRQVYASSVNVDQNEAYSTVDLGSLANGLYYVKVKAENINYSANTMIQH